MNAESIVCLFKATLRYTVRRANVEVVQLESFSVVSSKGITYWVVGCICSGFNPRTNHCTAPRGICSFYDDKGQRIPIVTKGISRVALNLEFAPHPDDVEELRQGPREILLSAMRSVLAEAA